MKKLVLFSLIFVLVSMGIYFCLSGFLINNTFVVPVSSVYPNWKLTMADTGWLRLYVSNGGRKGFLVQKTIDNRLTDVKIQPKLVGIILSPNLYGKNIYSREDGIWFSSEMLEVNDNEAVLLIYADERALLREDVRKRLTEYVLNTIDYFGYSKNQIGGNGLLRNLIKWRIMNFGTGSLFEVTKIGT